MDNDKFDKLLKDARDCFTNLDSTTVQQRLNHWKYGSILWNNLTPTQRIRADNFVKEMEDGQTAKKETQTTEEIGQIISQSS